MPKDPAYVGCVIREYVRQLTSMRAAASDALLDRLTPATIGYAAGFMDWFTGPTWRDRAEAIDAISVDLARTRNGPVYCGRLAAASATKLVDCMVTRVHAILYDGGFAVLLPTVHQALPQEVRANPLLIEHAVRFALRDPTNIATAGITYGAKLTALRQSEEFHAAIAAISLGAVWSELSHILKSFDGEALRAEAEWELAKMGEFLTSPAAAGDQATGARPSGGAGESTMPASPPSKLARALAVLQDHPDWTNKQIANAAGCNPKYLSQNRKFRAAREAIRGIGQETLARDQRFRGSDMDAYEDVDATEG
jgi:hypothetical protein